VRRAGTCLLPSISPDWFHIHLVGNPPIKTILLFQSLCDIFCFYFISPVFQQARGAVTTHVKEFVFSSVFVRLLLLKSSTAC
jgi:hypothetical protein